MKSKRIIAIICICFVINLSCSDKFTGMSNVGAFEKPLLKPEDDINSAEIKNSNRVFEQGMDGYHSYRIPSITTAPNGNLIAFAEGRKHTSLDYGDIDIVAKISNDKGFSWSPLRILSSEGNGTWGNPTVVTDYENSRVWLFMSWNSDVHSQSGGTFNGKVYNAVSKWGDRKVFSMYSDDNGITWSSPKDYTEDLLPKDFVWDAVGPGTGIQIENGPNKGRLIIPAGERNIYSDDNGMSWKYQRIPINTFEGAIVELSSGLLLRNDRAVSSTWNKGKYRYISKGSIEGGFTNFISDFNLIDPRCQGSILRISYIPNLIAFINPARNDGETMSFRCNMTIRLSNDDGVSWFASRALTYPNINQNELCSLGYGGYTSMSRINTDEIALLVEHVSDPAAGSAIDRKHSIDYHHVNIDWIKSQKK